MQLCSMFHLQKKLPEQSVTRDPILFFSVPGNLTFVFFFSILEGILSFLFPVTFKVIPF